MAEHQARSASSSASDAEPQARSSSSTVLESHARSQTAPTKEGRVERVALITGGSRGIGAAIAERFAAAGWDLTISARGVDALEATAESLRTHGGRVEVVPADMTDDDAIAALTAAHIEAYGRCDALVVNAGMGVMGGLAQFPIHRLDKLYKVKSASPVPADAAAAPDPASYRGRRRSGKGHRDRLDHRRLPRAKSHGVRIHQGGADLAVRDLQLGGVGARRRGHRDLPGLCRHGHVRVDQGRDPGRGDDFRRRRRGYRTRGDRARQVSPRRRRPCSRAPASTCIGLRSEGIAWALSIWFGHWKRPAHAYGADAAAASSGPGLTELGFAQARQTGLALAAQVPAITAAISGDLPRQRATLAGVLESDRRGGEHDGELIVDPGWNEYELPALPGAPSADLYSTPAAYQQLLDARWPAGRRARRTVRTAAAGRPTRSTSRGALPRPIARLRWLAPGRPCWWCRRQASSPRCSPGQWGVPAQTWPVMARAMVNASVSKLLVGRRGITVVSMNEQAHLSATDVGLATFR